MSRYALNFNPAGTDLLLDTNDFGEYLEFSRLRKPLKSGATTKVRLVENGGIPFTPRDDNNTRFGAAVSSKSVASTGLVGGKRYTLQRAGTGGWFNLVPHSKITKSRPVRMVEPGVTVSVING